jgi:hypothetical protein
MNTRAIVSTLVASIALLLCEAYAAPQATYDSALPVMNDGYLIVSRAPDDGVEMRMCPFGSAWVQQSSGPNNGACELKVPNGEYVRGKTLTPVSAQEALDLRFGKGTMKTFGLAPHYDCCVTIFYRIANKPQTTR